MKLAISTYSLLRWRRENGRSLEDSLEAIARLEVPAVEFAGLDDGRCADPIARAGQLRGICGKLGLEIAGYCVPAEFLVEPGEQRKVIKCVKHEVDVAAELGCRSMRHDVTRGPSGGQSDEQLLSAVVPAVREVAEYAAGKGIKASVENHGFYLQTADRVEALVQSVNHPNFGVTLDMGNFLCLGQDCVDAVRRLVKYAVMVHVKDFHVRRKEGMPATGWFATPTSIALRGAIVGHGVIDVPAQLKVLKDAGYDGYLSLEFEGIEEPLMAVKLGLEYLRAHGASD